MKTGDVGQWNKDGTLSVIDRLKNLVKLAGGEYIALERLEWVFFFVHLCRDGAKTNEDTIDRSIYKHCGMVSNICLVADSNANRAMAVRFHRSDVSSL